MIRKLLGLIGWRLLSLAFAGLFLITVAAHVSADVFGRFSLAMTVVTVAGGGLLSLGNHALLRFGRQAFAEDGAIGHAVWLRLELFAAAYLVVALVLSTVWPMLPGFFDIEADALPWLLLGLLVVPLGEMGTIAAQAAGRFTGFGIAPAVARGVHLAVLFGLIAGDAVSWRNLFLGAVAGYAAAAFCTWRSLPPGVLRRRRRARPKRRQFAAFGWSIPLASLSVAVIGAVDLWFLRGFRSVEEVGAYAWVYAIATMGTALLAPLGALLANRYLDLVYRSESERLRALLRQTGAVMLLSIGACVTAAGIFLFLGERVAAELGVYQAAVAAGAILLGGIGFQLGTNMWETMAFAREGRTWQASLLLALMALTNVLLDGLLVPPAGALGAALATSASYLVGALGLYALLRRGDEVDEPRPRRLAAAGLAALAALYAGSVAGQAGAAIMTVAGILLLGLAWARTDGETRAVLRAGLAAARATRKQT